MTGPGGVTWFYRPDGSPALYQQGKYLYDASTADCLYWQEGDWWLRLSDSAVAFWVHEKWVYTPDGVDMAYYRT